MPIFDYKCPACDITEEKIVKNSDIEVLCSRCTTPMIKLLSCPSFVLKGEGFFSSGSFPNAKKQGPHIPNHIKEMSDVDLNRSLGLPDDH